MSKYVRWKSLKSAVTNSCLFRRQITNFAIFSLSLTQFSFCELMSAQFCLLCCFYAFSFHKMKKKMFSYVCGESWWQKQPQCIYIVRRNVNVNCFIISRDGLDSWQSIFFSSFVMLSFLLVITTIKLRLVTCFYGHCVTELHKKLLLIWKFYSTLLQQWKVFENSLKYDKKLQFLPPWACESFQLQ